MKMNMSLKVLGSTSYSSRLLMTYRVAILVLVVFHIPAVKGLLKLPPNETVPAVIVFGDSIMDTGNNNNLKTLVKCNFPPYGQDFKAKKPTGRFGNGLVPSDIIGSIFIYVTTIPISLALSRFSTPNMHAYCLPSLQKNWCVVLTVDFREVGWHGHLSMHYS